MRVPTTEVFIWVGTRAVAIHSPNPIGCVAHTELRSAPPQTCDAFPVHVVLHALSSALPCAPKDIPQKQACPACIPKYLNATPVDRQS